MGGRSPGPAASDQRGDPPMDRKRGSMVGVRGFEPPTPCSQSRCATRLRYTPTPANPTITDAGSHAEPLTDIRYSLPLHLNQPETQEESPVDLRHGLGLQDTEPADQPALVDRAHLIQEHHGIDRQPSLRGAHQ